MHTHENKTVSVDIPPKHVLFSSPDKIGPQISPDGTKITYIAMYNGVWNIWIKSIDKNDDRPLTHDTGIGITTYSWLLDNQHLIYMQQQDQNSSHIFKFNIATRKIIDITPYKNVNARIISYRREFPDTMLISLNRNHPALYDVYKWDLKTDMITLVEKNLGNVTGWIADNNLVIKGAMCANQDGSTCLLIRDYPGATWKEVIRWEFEDSAQSSPVGFAQDNRRIYIRDSRNSNTNRLILLDPATKETQIVAQDETYDLSGIFADPVNHELISVTFTKERKEVVLLNDTYAEDFKTIKTLDHGDFSITDSSVDFNKWLILFSKDNGPSSYYIYDRTTKTGKFLFFNNGSLSQYELAYSEPITFEARDNLKIHGYLTYPTGVTEKTNLPIVVLVHGGPWVRDTWGFQPTVQWLATRGYAVLQVNFRGSAGYGKEFLNAGNKEWGRKMHHDIEDAVKWAVEKNIADKNKVAIFGSAYGGYEAMVAAAFSPDTFCCAVNIVGPLDLNKLANSFPKEYSHFKGSFIKRVGDPEKEKDLLTDRSPITRIEDIKIPVMIAQGKLDPRTSKEDSDKLVRHLRTKNINTEYLIFEDEGHGFVKPHNNMHFFATAEMFLARHLGGRCEQ